MDKYDEQMKSKFTQLDLQNIKLKEIIKTMNKDVKHDI